MIKLYLKFQLKVKGILKEGRNDLIKIKGMKIEKNTLFDNTNYNYRMHITRTS